MTNETDVYENLVYDMADDGLEVDGRASNVRIWGNTFHDVLMGISMAPVIDGPVYAIRNVIFRTGAGGRDGSAFKFNSDEGRSGPMYLFHNTADAAEPGQNALYIMEPGSWPLLYARNNVWAGTRFAIANENPRQKVDLDYDNLHTSEPGSLVWWDGLANHHLDSLGRVRSATGQEMHGLNVRPAFEDAAAGNYRLAAASSAGGQRRAHPGRQRWMGGESAGHRRVQIESGDRRVARPPARAPLRLQETRMLDSRRTLVTKLAAVDAEAPVVGRGYSLAWRRRQLKRGLGPGHSVLAVSLTLLLLMIPAAGQERERAKSRKSTSGT